MKNFLTWTERKLLQQKVLDGKLLSAHILQRLNQKIQDLLPLAPYKPSLAYVLVGTNPDSLSYISIKSRVCQQLGIGVVPCNFHESVSKEEVIECIQKLNVDEKIHGLLVQLPLPTHLNETEILDSVSPFKDLDCLTSENFGKLVMRGSYPEFLPCTPAGCMELLNHAGVELEGKHAVVVGRSNLAGLPLSMMLQWANATVTLCHSHTEDLAHHLRQADIVCVAAGCPKLITADMIKPGATVLDIGINSTPAGLVGDVDFEGVFEKVHRISPVPGGVGPMTVAMLMSNLVEAWQRTIPQ